jgi:hypothetical protein
MRGITDWTGTGLGGRYGGPQDFGEPGGLGRDDCRQYRQQRTLSERPTPIPRPGAFQFPPHAIRRLSPQPVLIP